MVCMGFEPAAAKGRFRCYHGDMWKVYYKTWKTNEREEVKYWSLPKQQNTKIKLNWFSQSERVLLPGNIVRPGLHVNLDCM